MVFFKICKLEIATDKAKTMLGIADCKIYIQLRIAVSFFLLYIGYLYRKNTFKEEYDREIHFMGVSV